jgi:hypothetical protein
MQHALIGYLWIGAITSECSHAAVKQLVDDRSSALFDTLLLLREGSQQKQFVKRTYATSM